MSVNPGTYPNGLTQSATLTIDAAGVPNSPLTLPVQLTIFASTYTPSGLMETPLDNSTGVTGSVAVTGWAIDDIGLTEVSIWRDPVAGESVSSANGKVFIGRAVQVDGARPDSGQRHVQAPRVCNRPRGADDPSRIEDDRG